MLSSELRRCWEARRDADQGADGVLQIVHYLVYQDVGFGKIEHLSAPNSCAPGVAVVNIGKGFSAGYPAAQINQTDRQDGV